MSIYIIILYYYYKALTKYYIGWSFQQDNAKIYKTARVLAWFKKNNIKLFPYLPYCPDLNPIKNIQSLLKNNLNKRYKGSLGEGKNIKSIIAFKRAILEEWDNISQEYINNAILSLPKRWETVI